VTAYRFCRTDDMARLVEAHNRCWLPHHPDEPKLDLEGFKRWVRVRSLWTSSCLIASEGNEPVGFSFGCKRESETLILRLAVHPDHLRRGHGRHLLTSISSKLAILGPPRLVAEVPEEAAAARALFRACDYVEEETLQDWRLEAPATLPLDKALLVPTTPADLQANGLLTDPPGIAWGRAVASLLAMKDGVEGLAVLAGEQVAGSILYIGSRIVALRGAPDALDRLLAAVTERQPGSLVIEKVSGQEFPDGWLASRGFRPGARHVRMAATARAA
jgi:ribosomal protein S18 acetylase RimI-like enzyme